MKDIRYLLSIKELLDSPTAEQLAKQAYEKLDGERKRKLEGIKAERRYAECLGAGLLLQLGVQELYKGKNSVHKESFINVKAANVDTVNVETVKAVTVDAEAADVMDTADVEPRHKSEPVRCLTLSQALSLLGEPIEITYAYGAKGKPYFQDIPVFFNLSHSEDYVCCVFSGQEVGVDIQYRKSLASDSLVRRFFAAAEQKLWENCSSAEEGEKLFYRLWTRKEAYGKLTGEGIAKAASMDVSTGDSLSVRWEDYEILDGYQLAVCKRIREKE